MAVYNGVLYIGTQIESILHQLGCNDELIIIDDASSDESINIIKGFVDARIKLYQNEINLGPTKTFNRALSLADGEIVFLSDQDDIWYDHKVATIIKYFQSTDIDLIVHDARVINEESIVNESLFEMCKSSPGLIRNIISSTHTGCCMALRCSALRDLLPIPVGKGIYHDSWIGVFSGCIGQRKLFLKIPLIDYRRHGNNVSAMRTRGLMKILPERFNLIIALGRRVTGRLLQMAAHLLH